MPLQVARNPLRITTWSAAAGWFGVFRQFRSVGQIITRCLMKMRILLLAGLSLSHFASAAGTASITGLRGQARGGAEGKLAALQSGQNVAAGAALETNGDSSMTLSLSGGGSLVLGPGTRIRIRAMTQSDSNPGLFAHEVVLLRGTLAGDTTGASPSSNFTLRTTVGAVNVAGCAYRVDFRPATASSGSLSVLALRGSPTLTSIGGTAPVTIPAGSRVTVSGGATPTPSPASAEELENATAALTGKFGGAGSPTPPPPAGIVAVPIPNTSLLVVSPNGEGTLP